MKVMQLMQKGEDAEVLLKDIKHTCINIINKEHNCGYDRAETTVICMLQDLQKLLKEKEII